MRIILLPLLVFFCLNCANSAINQDTVLVDTMYVSNDAISLFSDTVSPGKNVKIYNSKDKIIYYSATVVVINPTRNKYEVEIVCIDTRGKMIIQGKLERSLSENRVKQNGMIVKSVGQSLGLNPKPGVLVPGQIAPLVGGNDYYIKLYFDNELIGITKFHYEI